MFRTISHYRTQTQVLFAVTVAATVFIIQITASVVSSLEEDIQDHQHSVAKVKRQSKSSLRCPKPNGLFPYEEDCSKFLNCAHGRPYLQSCGPGTVFNPEILVCDFPWNVYCVNDRDITSDKHYGNKRGYDGQYTEHKVDHSISHADRHDDHQRPDHSIKNLNRHTEQDTEHRKPGSLSPEREILHLGQENQHSWKDSQQKGHINPLLGSDDQEIGQNAGELGFGIQQLEDDDHEPEKSRVPSVSHINRLKPTKPSSTRYQPTKQSSNQDKLNEPSTDQEQTEEPLLWKNVKKIVAKAGTKIKKKWRKLFSKVEDKNNEIATEVIQALNSTYLQVKKTVEEETKKLLKDDSEPQNLCLKPDGLFPYPKDCSKYVNCWKSRGILQSCAPGTLFDASSSHCGWPSNVVCTAQLKDTEGEIRVHKPSTPTLPVSGQLIRLRNGGEPYVGYVEVWTEKDWRPVVVAGEIWNSKDSVCRTLGFSRGSYSETRGMVYGRVDLPKSWQKAVVCSAADENPQDCPVKLVKKEEIESSIVGLRCRKNAVSSCPTGWFRWGKKCYYADTSQVVSHATARENCEAINSRLVSIASQGENDFISELLTSKSPRSTTGFHTGGMSVDLHGKNYWIWENTKLPHSSQLQFSKFWAGWPDLENKPFSSLDLKSSGSAVSSLCISLHVYYSVPNDAQSFYNAQYYFWKLEDCGEKHHFACERDPFDIGCISGRGETYNGTANITMSGASCLRWEAHRGSLRYLPKPGEVKENYCSNPDGDDLPWCFVEGGTTEFCDIPRCATTEPIFMDLTSSPTCDAGTFGCSNGNCIHLEWVCDGQMDCDNGEDESNCPDFQDMFIKQSGMKLIGSEVEKWLHSPKTTCASRCAQAKAFVCYSFNYEESSSTCILSKSNSGTAGGLISDMNWEYHERVDLAPDCSKSFKCSDSKCIKGSMVCDGRRDCREGDDERDCIDMELFQVRLLNGSGHHEGRVEIRVGDEWGQVCDDMWGLQDGHVVCKQLGFSRGAKAVFTNSRYGDGEGDILMDDLNCKGDEESLALCDFGGWYHHDCKRSETAGVQCYQDTDVCSARQWQCDNGRCIEFAYYCDQIDDCGDNSDENIELCASPVQLRLMSSSSHGKQLSSGRQSWSSPTDGREGRVEIRYKGLWGTLCDDDVNIKEGHVLCRMLGYDGAAAVYKNNTFGSGTGPIWLDGLQCLGNEVSIMECRHDQWGRSNCDHTEDLSITCTNSISSDVIQNNRMFDKPPEMRPLAGALPAKCGITFVEDSPKDIIASPRIVKGHIPRPGAQPWMAGIRRRTHFGSTHECGGSILSEDLILTAAHCILKYTISEYIVRTGDYDNEEKDVLESEWRVENMIMHPEFNKDTHFNNDLAILKIKRKSGRGIRFNERVQPLCLVPNGWSYTPGLNCTVAGWGTMSQTSGYSRILQSTLLPILPSSECRADHVYGPTRIASGMFCAGYMEGGIDTCQGDSGGPLVCFLDGRYTAVGITSWGHGCARANKPGVYTKLTYYLEWIYETLKTEQSVTPKTL